MEHEINVECGGRGGYRRHLRRGENPCSQCTEANTSHQRDYRAGVRKSREAKNVRPWPHTI